MKHFHLFFLSATCCVTFFKPTLAGKGDKGGGKPGSTPAPTPVPTQAPVPFPSTYCAAAYQDPFGFGAEIGEVDCCYSTVKCLKEWSPGAWYYLCVPCSESGQCANQADFAAHLTDSTKCPKASPDLVNARTSASPKRGVAWKEMDSTHLTILQSTVSWGYTWQPTPTFASLSDYSNNFVDFYPMIWDETYVTDSAFSSVPDQAQALLGFNEPNFVEQANMSPEEAANLWPQLEQLALDKSIPTLVSPAVNFSPDTWQPIEWLREFFRLCPNCRVDAIAMHSYTCDASYLDQHIRKYYEFSRPIWLTEFACADGNNFDASGQATYMVDAVPYLESNQYVEKYAWFSYDFGGGVQAALATSSGLTPLGELYRDLADVASTSSAPTDAPQTPAPTAAPTSLATKACFEELSVPGSCIDDTDCCSGSCSGGNPKNRACQAAEVLI